MNLKSKLMMMSRKALVATAAGALVATATIAVGATAYVRNEPILVTAGSLANSLVGRGAEVAQTAVPAPADVARVEIVIPASTPAPLQTAEQLPAADATQVQETVRSTISPEQPVAQATSTPGAEPAAPAATAEPTSTTARPIATSVRKGQRSARHIAEMCK